MTQAPSSVTTGEPQAAPVDTEYMLEPVPTSARRSTWKQVAVWVGFGYVVTGLFVGGALAGFGGANGVPPGTALLAIFLGMGFLTLLTVLLGVIAQRTGLNLALVSRYSYGSKGANLPLIVMALLTLGWFASITGMVGQIWSSWIGNPTGIIVFAPETLGFVGVPAITLENVTICIIFGLLFTWTAYKGIEAIEKVAVPVAPFILAVALIVGGGMIMEGGGLAAFFEKANQISGMGIGTAITLVMGSWIAGVVMGVDLFRFTKSIKAVIWCALACFIFTNPMLNIIGYIGAVSVGQFNFVEWMAEQGWIFALIGVVVWTTSLWTTNNAELYCNSLYTGPVISSFGKKANRGKIVLIVGIAGTIVGSLGFYQMFFSSFITVLGAAFLPLAGPLVADYYISRRQKYDLDALHTQPAYRPAGIISFIVGATLGLTFEYVWRLPADLPSGLVALIITTLLYVVLFRVFEGNKTTTATR